ncbi:MAG: ADP-forming succinate--CoA ligase subunit beta [Pseudomonadota bacterium]
MNLHEYQAKTLLRDAGVTVPEGRVIRSLDDVAPELAALGAAPWVMKVQVHAGGRGKAGGVRVVHTPSEARDFAAQWLGKRLVSVQTGAAGLPVNALYIEPASRIARELYLSLLIDRATSKVTFIASDAGGMDIEEVAATTPERIHALSVHPAAGLMPYHARKLSFALGLAGEQAKAFAALLKGLYTVFTQKDASMLEINPLALTEDGALLALDCKFILDSNAAYRQPQLVAMRDEAQEDEREREAVKHQLNYVTLEGDIACMVNGAGLAMATMDLISLEGGQPANFLDVGGGATAERVAEAFKLILSDAKVRAILINIFGGIVRCDLIAEGILQAVREVDLQLPLVVRLEGTNAAQGRALLAESGLNLIAETDLTRATQAVVQAAKSMSKTISKEAN